jgi:hypothetical protein
MLATLHAVATTASLRAAATGIHVHHSTLQGRLPPAAAPPRSHARATPARTPARPHESPISSGKSSALYRRAPADITVR